VRHGYLGVLVEETKQCALPLSGANHTPICAIGGRAHIENGCRARRSALAQHINVEEAGPADHVRGAYAHGAEPRSPCLFENARLRAGRTASELSAAVWRKTSRESNVMPKTMLNSGTGRRGLPAPPPSFSARSVGAVGVCRLQPVR